MRLLNRDKLEAWAKKQRNYYSRVAGKPAADRHNITADAYQAMIDALDQSAVEDEPNEKECSNIEHS